MAPNPRRIAAKLDELYAQLPAIDCQGLCTDSCGIAPAGPVEVHRLEQATQRPFGYTTSYARVGEVVEACNRCTMLVEGRCAGHDLRPAICRLWGVSEDLPCPYGCKPERVLTVEEGYGFLTKVYAIAGAPPGWDGADDIAELVADPRDRAKLIAHNRPTLEGRKGSLAPTVIEKGKPL